MRKIKINKKLFLENDGEKVDAPQGLTDDAEDTITFIKDDIDQQQLINIIQGPKDIAAMSDENESAFSAIMRQGIETQEQGIDYELRTCSEKAGWARMLIVPIAATLGVRTLLSVNRWASAPGTSIKSPFAVARDNFREKFGKPDPHFKNMVDGMNAQVENSMESLRKDLGPAAAENSRKQVKRARGSNIGASTYNGFVWLGVAASVGLLGVNTLELGTGEWEEGAPATVKFYLEVLALSEWAMKATVSMISLGPLDEENPFSDPCIIYPIIASAATFTGTTWAIRRSRRGTSRESMKQVENTILRRASQSQRSLSEDLLSARSAIGERLLKDSRFENIPSQLQKDYVRWLDNYKINTTRGADIPSQKLKQILDNNFSASGMGKGEYYGAFQQFTKEYNSSVAKTSNKIVTAWLGKSKASKKELAEVLGGQIKFNKNIIAGLMKYPKLMAARLSKTPSRVKGSAPAAELPKDTEDALRVLSHTRELNLNTVDMVRDFTQTIKNANRKDPAQLLATAKQQSAALESILENVPGISPGVPANIKADLRQTIKYINNQPDLTGKILDRILSSLKIDKSVLKKGSDDALNQLTSKEIASALTENLVRKFYGKGATEVTDAQVKELTKFCKNMEKSAIKMGIKNKMLIGALAALGATGVVGFWMTDKQITTSGYYFKGEPGLGRWTADLLNSLFSNKVIKATSDIHYKMVMRGDRKNQVRDVLKGVVYVSEDNLESYLRDENILRTDEQGRISFKGFLMNLKKREYESASEALDAFVEMRMTQLMKYSKKSSVQAANPDFEDIDKELLTYMVEVYVHGSMFPIKMKKFIEKQQSEGFVGSPSRFESAIKKLFKFGRNDITSVLQSMSNIEKTVVSSHEEHLSQPGPAIQNIVPQQDINIQSERPPQQTREIKDMNLIDLEKLVAEVLNENTGQGYMNYPYHSEIANNGEEAEDFIQDWKDFELALVRDQSRNIAIEVAKILVKDLELFGDVLDLVGKNQSVATEILKSMKNVEEKS